MQPVRGCKRGHLPYNQRLASMAELVDAPDSKSGIERCSGSTPDRGTSHCVHPPEEQPPTAVAFFRLYDPKYYRAIVP